MRVKLRELQQIVDRAIAEERESDVLRAEIGRVLGTTVVTEGRIEHVAESANDRIDVLVHTGRENRVAFKPSVMVKFLEHADPNVRKLAARVVPHRYLSKVMHDKSGMVRLAVAKRLPPNAVSEMLRRYPRDMNVREILRAKKRLQESGLPKPEVVDEPFDMYGEERLGDAVKQDEGSELSDFWYEHKALNFIQDYGGNIEDAWEEKAVHRYCASAKATAGVEIDEKKLLKAIREKFEERDDRALERNSLKETHAWLLERDTMSESFMPIIEEQHDPVATLIESGLSSSTYIDKAMSVFGIKEGNLPPGIRKHRLGEGNARWTSVPVVGSLPHKRGFRAIDERALDAFCKHWNDRQILIGEPIKIGWSTSPVEEGRVSFNVTLR